MTATKILSDLLNKPAHTNNNINLLRKIILTTFVGQLRVNSLLPDKRFNLADYLVDDQSIIFDFKQLTESKRRKFITWLLAPHEKEKNRVFLHRQGTNTSRGYLAEVKLNWWGKLKSWLFNEHFDHWDLDEINLIKQQQLTGVTIRQDKKGLIVSFSQFGISQLFTNQNYGKYSDPEQLASTPDGNVKRVVLNNVLVDLIMNKKLKPKHFTNMISRPHPMSIDVKDYPDRYLQMYDHRLSEYFNTPRPWYLRLIDWLVKKVRSWLSNTPLKQQTKQSPQKNIEEPRTLIGNNDYGLGGEKKTEAEPLAASHTDSKGKSKGKKKSAKNHQQCPNPKHSQTCIAYRKGRKDFVVTELRPADKPMLVFCGGGPKIYAHVGVMKAFKEARIKPVRFAGSSAGAIMSLLCYMGYDGDEMAELLEPIKKEHLVRIQMSKKGLSSSNRLEAFLDYIISKKLYAITKKYGLPYPEEKITFAYLESLRQKYPDCGLGEELVVTATDISEGNTKYFSFHSTPDTSVSTAVCASASLPVLFKPKELSDGKIYSDGGVTVNFPVDAFSNGAALDKSHTLLSSSSGIRPEVIGIQFDYGHEEDLLYKIKKTVYRENWLLNWIYSLLTGVSDPASNWVEDRFKLKENPLQSMVVKADTESYLSPTKREKRELMESGYKTAAHYINSRYKYSSKDKKYKNVELMMEHFDSLEELLIHCSMRGHYFWFNEVHQMILNTDYKDEIFQYQSKRLLLERAQELKNIYFPHPSLAKNQHTEKEHFADLTKSDNSSTNRQDHIAMFLAIYPLMLNLSQDWFHKNSPEQVINDLRDVIQIDSPIQCLDILEGLTEPHHFLIELMKITLQHIKKSDINQPEIQTSIKNLTWLFKNPSVFSDEIYIQQWQGANLNWDELLALLMREDLRAFIDRAKVVVDNSWLKIETTNILNIPSTEVELEEDDDIKMTMSFN